MEGEGDWCECVESTERIHIDEEEEMGQGNIESAIIANVVK